MDSADWQVAGTVVPSWLKRDIKQAVAPSVLNDPERRSAAALCEVVAQFALELGNTDAHRYQPRDVDGIEGNETFCNFFVNEVTRALGCEIPKSKANEMFVWLKLLGPRQGWWPVGQELARLLSLSGIPVVAAWQNPLVSQPGHVALVVPPPGVGIWIAQAGARCFSCNKLEAGFGSKTPLFFAHH